MFKGDLARNTGLQQDLTIYGMAVLVGCAIVVANNQAAMEKHPAKQAEMTKLTAIAEQIHDIGIRWAHYDIR